MSRANRRSSILKNTSTLAFNDGDSSRGTVANTSSSEDVVPNRRRSSVGFNRRVSFSARVVVQVFQADSDLPTSKRSVVDARPVGALDSGARTSATLSGANNDEAGANADQSVYMDVENGSFYVTSDYSRRSIQPNTSRLDQFEAPKSVDFAENNVTMNMSLCSTTLIDENRNTESETLKPHDTSDMLISNDTRHHETQFESTRQASGNKNDPSSNRVPKDLKDRTQHDMVSMCISTLGEADTNRMVQSVGSNNDNAAASQSCNLSDMELTMAYDTTVMQPKTVVKPMNVSMKARPNESCMDISSANSSYADAMSMCTVVMDDTLSNSAVFAVPAKATGGQQGATTLSANSQMQKQTGANTSLAANESAKLANVSQRAKTNESCMEISAVNASYTEAMSLCTVMLKDADASNSAVFAVPTEPAHGKQNTTATGPTQPQKDANSSNAQEASDMEISCMLERTQINANASTKQAVVTATRAQVNVGEHGAANSSAMEISMLNDTCARRLNTTRSVPAQANQTNNEAGDSGVISAEPAANTAKVTDAVERSFVTSVPLAEASRQALVAPTPTSARHMVEPVSSATVHGRMSGAAWSNESLVDFRHRPVLESTALPTPTARRFSAMNFTTPRTEMIASSHLGVRERSELIEEHEVPEKTRKLDVQQPNNLEPEQRDASQNQTAVLGAQVAVNGSNRIADCASASSVKATPPAFAPPSVESSSSKQTIDSNSGTPLQMVNATFVLPLAAGAATQSQVPVGVTSASAVPPQCEAQNLALQKDMDALKEGSAKVVGWMFERLSESLRALDSHESDDSDSDSMIELDGPDSGGGLLPTCSPGSNAKPDMHTSTDATQALINRTRFDASTSQTTTNRTLSSTIGTTALRRRTMAKSALDVLATLRRSIVRARENATRADDTANSRYTTRLDDTAGHEPVLDQKSRRQTFTVSRDFSETSLASSHVSAKVRRVPLKERLEELIRRKNAALTVEQVHASYRRFQEFSVTVSQLAGLASLTDPNANDQLTNSASYETLFAAYKHAVSADELRSICIILNDFYLPFINKYADALRCVANAPADADCSQLDDTSMFTTTDASYRESEFAELEHAIELFAKVHFASWKKRTLESVARSLDSDSVARFMSTKLNNVRAECAQLEDANLVLRMRIDSLRLLRQATAATVPNARAKQPDQVVAVSQQRRNAALSHEADEATKLQIRKRVEELQARRERHRVDIVELSQTLETTRARVLQLETEANNCQGAVADRSSFRDAILNYETLYLAWRVESLKRTDAQHYTAHLSALERTVHVVLSVAENDLCCTNINTPIAETLAQAIASRDMVEKAPQISCTLTANSAITDWPVEFAPIRKLYAQVLSSLVADLNRIQVPCNARSFCTRLSRCVIAYQRLASELRRISKVAQVSLPDAQRPDLLIEFCQKRALKTKPLIASLTGTGFLPTSDQLNKLIAYTRQLPNSQLTRFRLTLKNFDMSAYAASYWAALAASSSNRTIESTYNPGFSAAEFAPLGEFSNVRELNPLFDDLQTATERVRSKVNNLLRNNVSREAVVREHGLILSLTELALTSA